MRGVASGPGTTKAPSREYKGVELGMGNWLLGACYLELETGNLELVLGAQVPGLYYHFNLLSIFLKSDALSISVYDGFLHNFGNSFLLIPLKNHQFSLNQY